MRQACVIRYLVVGALLLFLAACANFPSMRTSMPPAPAETPPAAAPPAQVQVPAADLAQQIQKLEARVQQLESQVAKLEGRKGAPVAVKPRPRPAPPTTSPAKPTAPSPASEKYYTEGMRLYHAKKYREGRNQLYQYLKNQPRGPKAPEARYYLADSFYQEGKYREAAVEFNKLRRQSPKSILAPAGLLRQALCYKNQQQMRSYRSTLKKLVKAYPNSPEAKEAQKMLKENSSKPTGKAPGPGGASSGKGSRLAPEKSR
jgi:tol-pal system protein YbgF